PELTVHRLFAIVLVERAHHPRLIPFGRLRTPLHAKEGVGQRPTGTLLGGCVRLGLTRGPGCRRQGHHEPRPEQYGRDRNGRSSSHARLLPVHSIPRPWDARPRPLVTGAGTESQERERRIHRGQISKPPRTAPPASSHSGFTRVLSMTAAVARAISH